MLLANLRGKAHKGLIRNPIDLDLSIYIYIYIYILLEIIVHIQGTGIDEASFLPHFIWPIEGFACFVGY